MGTTTAMTDRALALLRLLQLSSPSLPIGGFSYSQGIEWAVEAGWLVDAGSVDAWLRDQLTTQMAYVDLPLLARMHAAIRNADPTVLSGWIDWLIAMREGAEARAEEANRGRALADLLVTLGLADAPAWRGELRRSQCAAFAFAAARFVIEPRDAVLGYSWAWLEGLVTAAVKLVPLGQSDGQRLLISLAGQIPGVVDQALELEDQALGASLPALAIAGAQHESQYTRLFRS